MNKKGMLVALLLLTVLTACAKTLGQEEARALVRDYLAPFKVEKLEFKSMTRTRIPGTGDAYAVVADFVVPYQGQPLHPMPGQTFYITFNELSRRFEINPQLTHVAQGIQGMIDIRKTADALKKTPYNPSPWNQR